MTNFQAFQKMYDDSHLHQPRPSHYAFLQLLHTSGCWQLEDMVLEYYQETHLWTAIKEWRSDISLQ